MDNQTATLDIMGRSIHELRGGSGTPLVYLHSSMGETSMWLPYMQELARSYEFHAPTHPGFGTSTGLDTIRDMDDLVYHYLAYFDAMGWDAVDVVGLSFGGWIAAEIAARYPERIKRLVLCGAVGIRVEGTPIHDIFVADIRFPDRVIDVLFHDTTCPPAAMLKAMMGLEIPDEMLADIVNARAATAKIGWNPLLHDPRLPALLGRVTAPTLCLWGEHDQIVPTVYAQRYAELIPEAQVTVVPACGHLVPLEKQPEFLGAVTSFLS